MGVAASEVMSQRRVINSPFGHAHSGAPPPSVPQSDPSPFTPPSVGSPKYAPPPLVGQSAPSPPPTTGPRPAVNQSNLQATQGGKLSSFADLSNKRPPTLYEVPNAFPQHPSGPVGFPPAGSSDMSGSYTTCIPCPTQIIPCQESDQPQHYQTCVNPIPPPAASEYVVHDQGNCSVRFMRSSANVLPNSPAQANQLGFPLGVVVQPLGDTQAGDTFLPLITPSGNLPRCSRCHGYHNALNVPLKGGTSYVCFLCQHTNQLEQQGTNVSMSFGSTHEDAAMTQGSVEYITPSDYIDKSPTPASFVFLIETSANALQTGIIQSFVDSMKAILPALPSNSPVRFAFVTFERDIRFYNLAEGRTRPQIFVMVDQGEGILPVAEPLGSFLVTWRESSEQIEQFLDLLPSLCEPEVGDEIPVCTGAAIRTTGLLLKQVGGKIVIIQSSRPTAPPAELANRYSLEYLGTSREKELYRPQNSYYEDMANDCRRYRISFDHFLFAHGVQNYLDVASLLPLTKLTGGQMYYYTKFNYENDRLKFHYQLYRILTRTSGKSALVRIRTSPGVDVTQLRGSFRLENDTDMSYSSINSDTTLCADLTVRETLPDESSVGIQVVVLYTTSFGESRIRIHSKQIPVSSNYRKVMAAADVDSIVYLNCARYFELCFSKDLPAVRETIVEDCLPSLQGFKKHSGHSIGPELALPDALRLYPLYQLCLLKSAFFKDSRTSVDYRLAERHMLWNMPLKDFMI